MDIAEIFKLVLNLFSKNEANSNQVYEQPKTNIQAQNDLNSSFWQLPNYNEQQTKEQDNNKIPQHPPENKQSENNILNLLSNININALVELISTLSQFFKNTKKEKEPTLKDNEPSFISNLHKIDNY